MDVNDSSLGPELQMQEREHSLSFCNSAKMVFESLVLPRWWKLNRNSFGVQPHLLLCPTCLSLLGLPQQSTPNWWVELKKLIFSQFWRLCSLPSKCWKGELLPRLLSTGHRWPASPWVLTWSFLGAHATQCHYVSKSPLQIRTPVILD